MRVPINLASHPPENLRPLRTGVILLTLAAIVFAGIILNRELRSRSEFRALIDRQNQLEQDLRNLHGQQADLESTLSTPQAMQIRERSAFLNSLILRKGLSWTQIFMDLEKTLPEKAHILSIHPALSSDGQIDLTLSIAADSIKPLVDFVQRLEASKEFGSPVVGGQRYASDKSANGEISMDLTTRYHQEHLTPSAGAATDTATTASQAALSDRPNGADNSTAQEARR